jgi:antitoxin VapB
MARRGNSRDSVQPVKARVFRNGSNQAIRIPVDMSFDTDEVTIERRGDALVIRPKPGDENCWESFFADPANLLPADFDTGEDPPVEDREIF